MTSPRDRLLVSLMAYAGLRCGEALALPWSNVLPDRLIVDRSFTGGELKPTKTGLSWMVDLVGPLSDELAEARPQDVDGQLPVVPAHGGGCLNLDSWRWRCWLPAVRASGVKPRPKPYDCRHTFASLRLNEGWLPQKVGRQMGHTTIRMMDRYAHLYTEGELSHRTPMADAIRAARVKLAAEGVQKMGNAELNPTASGAKKPASSRHSVKSGRRESNSRRKLGRLLLYH
jgi:integrase